MSKNYCPSLFHLKFWPLYRKHLDFFYQKSLVNLSAKNLIAILFSFQVSLFGKEEAVRKCQWKPQIRKCGGLLVWAVCTCRHGNGQKKIRKVRWGKKEHLCVCPSLADKSLSAWNLWKSTQKFITNQKIVEEIIRYIGNFS